MGSVIFRLNLPVAGGFPRRNRKPEADTRKPARKRHYPGKGWLLRAGCSRQRSVDVTLAVSRMSAAKVRCHRIVAREGGCGGAQKEDPDEILPSGS